MNIKLSALFLIAVCIFSACEFHFQDDRGKLYKVTMTFEEESSTTETTTEPPIDLSKLIT